MCMQIAASQPGSSPLKVWLTAGSGNVITMGWVKQTRLCVSHHVVDRSGRILNMRVKVYRSSCSLGSKLAKLLSYFIGQRKYKRQPKNERFLISISWSES